MASKLEVELDDGVTRVTKLLGQAEKQKDSIKQVRIEYWGDGFLGWTTEQYVEVFGRMGNLPSVEEIMLHYDMGPPLPVEALSGLFQRYNDRNHLDYLSLNKVSLAGTRESFDAFANSILSSNSNNKPFVQKAALIKCSRHGGATNDDHDANNTSENLGFFVSALAKAFVLESIHVEKTAISGESLAALCSSCSLKELELWDVPDLNHHVHHLAAALAHNSVLKELQISSKHDQKAGTAILEALKTNTSLETLGVDLDFVDFGVPIAEALAMNQSLISLHLRIVKKVEHQQAAMIISNTIHVLDSLGGQNKNFTANSKNNNSTLRNLHINLKGITPSRVADELVKSHCLTNMLRHNYSLENLSLRGNDHFVSLGREIEFLLRLNRAGRYQLLMANNSASLREDWLTTILNHKYDTSVVFYFLSMKPSILLSMAKKNGRI